MSEFKFHLLYVVFVGLIFFSGIAMVSWLGLTGLFIWAVFMIYPALVVKAGV